MRKAPATVETEKLPNGMTVPKTVIRKDGRRFSVSRVLFYSNFLTGEYEGIRYTIIIGSVENTFTESITNGM